MIESRHGSETDQTLSDIVDVAGNEKGCPKYAGIMMVGYRSICARMVFTTSSWHVELADRVSVDASQITVVYIGTSSK